MRKQLRRLKNNIKRYLSKRKFINKIDIKSDEWFFILPYGIGDLYLFISLLNAFKRENNSQNVSIGLVKQFQSQLFEVFDVQINRIVIINNNELQFCSRNSLSIGKPIILHPEYFFPKSFYSLIGYKGITLNDVYKLMLNLPIQTKNEKPILNQIHLVAAYTKYNLYNPERNQSVLLSPHANSFVENTIAFEFWQKLTEELNLMDYRVLINSNKQPFIDIKHVVPVDFSLTEAIPFVEHCEFFIGVRSGFCDLISTAKTKKIIIYPDMNWYTGTYLSGSGLYNMGLANDPITEIEIGKNSTEIDLLNILNIINT